MCWVVIVVLVLRVRRGRGRRRCGATGRSSPRPSRACIRRVRGRRRPVWPARRPRRRPCGTAPRTGAGPTRTASASVAANGVSATPVRPIPARSMRPSGVEPDDGRRRRPWRSRRPCARAWCRRRPALRAPRGCGSRSGPRSARWRSVNVSRKKSRAVIWRSPAWLRQTIVALTASRNAGQSLAGSACATEPPIVPQLRTCGSPIAAGQVDEPRVVVLDDLVVVDLAMGRPGADAQVVVGLADAVEAGDVPHVDEQGRLGQPELDEGDQAVAAREQLRLPFAVLEDRSASSRFARTDVVELSRGSSRCLPPPPPPAGTGRPAVRPGRASSVATTGAAVGQRPSARPWSGLRGGVGEYRPGSLARQRNSHASDLHRSGDAHRCRTRRRNITMPRSGEGAMLGARPTCVSEHFEVRRRRSAGPNWAFRVAQPLIGHRDVPDAQREPYATAIEAPVSR